MNVKDNHTGGNSLCISSPAEHALNKHFNAGYRYKSLFFIDEGHDQADQDKHDAMTIFKVIVSFMTRAGRAKLDRCISEEVAL